MKNKKHKPKPEIKENDCSKNGVDGAKRVDDDDEESMETMETMETCKHEWECLRDRCHNRGKGKYMAYKCRLCNKFQRRG